MAAEDYINFDMEYEPCCYILNNFTVVEETEKGIKIRHGEIEEWMPKAAIKGISEDGMEVFGWIVNKKALPFEAWYP